MPDTEVSTLTFDEYGHAVVDGKQATDAYGHMNYTLAVGEDCICFDAAALPDGRVELISVVNSESGGFIQTFQHALPAAGDALVTADGMIDCALDWFAENWPGKRVTGKRSIQTFRKDLRGEVERASTMITVPPSYADAMQFARVLVALAEKFPRRESFSHRQVLTAGKAFGYAPTEAQAHATYETFGQLIRRECRGQGVVASYVLGDEDEEKGDRPYIAIPAAY